MRLSLPALALAAAACGPSTSSGPAVDPEVRRAEYREGGGPADVDWSEYPSWTPALASEKPSPDHGASSAQIYLRNEYAESYLGGAAAVPPGFAAALVSLEGGAVKGVYAMAKMAPGYDPEEENWYYAVLDSNLRLVEEGKLAGCVACHREAAADYLFGLATGD